MKKRPLGYLFVSAARRVFRRLDKEATYRYASYKYGYRTVDAKARVKRIGGGYHGSKQEYRDTVLKYWSKYGIKPQKVWYDLYCDGMDAYNPYFIPDPVWFHDIIPYFNDSSRKDAYADKGMFNRILLDVKKPETVVKNMAGYYYNGDREQLIGRDEAEELCSQEEHLIFKPFRGSGGKGISFFDKGEKTRDDLHKMFSDYGSGFVAQRIVKQHTDLARLNPSSLNTIRVLSFHFKGEVHILSSQLRIGGSGSRVDNVCAGGFACSIYPDGRLCERSVTRKSTWTDETPSGVKLASVRVPNYEGVVETVKRLHCELPYFNIIGWDFSVGEDETPIMIEYNMRPAQNQIGGREPTFGDLTDEVLDEVFIKKTMKK